jgi:hypothetical protein
MLQETNGHDHTFIHDSQGSLRNQPGNRQSCKHTAIWLGKCLWPDSHMVKRRKCIERDKVGCSTLSLQMSSCSGMTHHPCKLVGIGTCASPLAASTPGWMRGPAPLSTSTLLTPGRVRGNRFRSAFVARRLLDADCADASARCRFCR